MHAQGHSFLMKLVRIVRELFFFLKMVSCFAEAIITREKTSHSRYGDYCLDEILWSMNQYDKLCGFTKGWFLKTNLILVFYLI